MNDSCSIDMLETALSGQLDASDEARLHRHLDECEACSAALARLAGGEAWDREAATLLAGDPLDAEGPQADSWSEVDFTVEHLEPAGDPNLLGRLGGYDILEIIGRGGMGVVLKGFDPELKRCVALKVLAPHLAQSSIARKRFAREAQAAAAVVHPNVLAIHQVWPAGKLPFLVMPLVAGESLAERLRRQGRLELKEVLRIGMQAAAGLEAAHEQGLVHRDVKPANILLEKGVERAVLTDFGLACAADDMAMTRYGIIAGTPQYMSPEQAQGESLDGRSDLFGLGCVLYEMATGTSPFLADSVMATIRRLIDDAPQSPAALYPELPPWFTAIVERLLEKDPAERFGSAKEVSEVLEGCLAHVQQPASVPLPAAVARIAKPDSSGRRTRRLRRTLVAGALAGAVAFGLFLAAATSPPDIAGAWHGEDWGTVELTKVSDTGYTGTYRDRTGGAEGELNLKWSRIERRFYGTWREGSDRFGELSVRQVDHELRGALTTDARSKMNPATPRLADLAWRRGPEEASSKPAEPKVDTPHEIELSAARRQLENRLRDLHDTKVELRLTSTKPGWGDEQRKEQIESLTKRLLILEEQIERFKKTIAEGTRAVDGLKSADDIELKVVRELLERRLIELTDAELEMRLAAGATSPSAPGLTEIDPALRRKYLETRAIVFEEEVEWCRKFILEHERASQR